MVGLLFEWFKLFVQMIPPLRPMLLIMDGHGSHITIDVIEYAVTYTHKYIWWLQKIWHLPFQSREGERSTTCFFKDATPQVPTFSIIQFENQYAEGYDVQDAAYLAWKNMYHPSSESESSTAIAISNLPMSVSACRMMSTAYHAATSTTTSTSSNSLDSVSSSVMTTPSLKSLPSSEEVLNELLVLPQALPSKTG